MIAKERKIPLLLFLVFLIFYLVQIPPTTYKGDVIAFALRSLEKSPILNFAFLPPNTFLNCPTLPNYHLGHTIILWTFYHIFPPIFQTVIIPSGILASFFGSISVTLTYLIWRELSIEKKVALISAIAFGLVPTFWEHSTIGEIHTMQMAFILLFILYFLKDKLIMSSLFFLIANLITPLSGISFGLVFLRGLNIETIKRASIVGGLALIIYIIIYYFLGVDFTNLLNTGNIIPEGRGILYRISILMFFILINFNFFTYYLIAGIKNTFFKQKEIYLALTIALIPHLLLVFITEGLFIELGSMQHTLFWIFTFPLGLYIAHIKPNIYRLSLFIIFSFILTYIFWTGPHRYIGKSLDEAGNWLKNNGYENTKLVAPWSIGLNIITSRNGSNLATVKSYYIDEPYPSTKFINETNLDSLLIGIKKKGNIRNILSEINVPGFSYYDYMPQKIIKVGKTKKIFENDCVILYKWKK